MNKEQFFNLMKSKGRTNLDDNDYFAYQLGQSARPKTIKQQTAIQQQKIINQIKQAGKLTINKTPAPRVGANNTMTYEKFAKFRKMNGESSSKYAYNTWLRKHGYLNDPSSETDKSNENVHHNEIGGHGIKKNIPSDVHNKVVGKSTQNHIPPPKKIINNRENSAVSDPGNSPEYRDMLEHWDYKNFIRAQQGLEPLPKPVMPEKQSQNTQMLGSQNTPIKLNPQQTPIQQPKIITPMSATPKQRMQVSATDTGKDPSEIVVGEQPPQRNNRRMIM